MEKLTEVLAMGGYALFVWPAYALAFIAMFYVAFVSLRGFADAKNRLKTLQLAADTDEA